MSHGTISDVRGGINTKMINKIKTVDKKKKNINEFDKNKIKYFIYDIDRLTIRTFRTNLSIKQNKVRGITIFITTR